jgi:CRP-like cAMP-binding protein
MRALRLMNSPVPSDVRALRKIRFFEDFTDEDLVRVAKVGQRRSYAAGETMIERDSAAGGFFIILGGKARVEVAGTAHELGPGDFFGEMALLGRRHRPPTVAAVEPVDFFGERAVVGRARRSASVTAVEPVDALVVETPYFDALLRQNASLAIAILHGVVERLWEVQDRLDRSAE